MCLTVTDSTKHTAADNIIVYKPVIKTSLVDVSDVTHGTPFKGVIYGIPCEGKIAIEGDTIFYCTNEIELDGAIADDRLGYSYSWRQDKKVQRIEVNGVQIFKPGYLTPYRDYVVTLNVVCNSKLRFDGKSVYEGFHSYKRYTEAANSVYSVCVLKCVIPKGAEYYKGTFDGAESYASSQIIFLGEV